METEIERLPALFSEHDDEGMSDDETLTTPEDEENEDDLDAGDEDDEDEGMEM